MTVVVSNTPQSRKRDPEDRKFLPGQQITRRDNEGRWSIIGYLLEMRTDVFILMTQEGVDAWHWQGWELFTRPEYELGRWSSKAAAIAAIRETDGVPPFGGAPWSRLPIWGSVDTVVYQVPT
ncbi:hypothetical protein [Bradyrhizobium stylosanthis]|uniref:hypothetical protein n=1 Tax=Bradyrhizobium stylosanthis TaxID=1803665 RepID=UPI0007C5BBCE|nr:hypothetical protein [Bradyrhizobium stylosanthis]